MTRNLKALGLALVAVFAMSAVAAQGASAHEFHADGTKVDITAKQLNAQEFTVGTAGTVKCNEVQAGGTQHFETEVTSTTFANDTVTVAPMYAGCTFGGNPATVNFEHCAYVFDSDTTPGNTTNDGEHANVEIECSPGNTIKIATSLCTLTVGPQTIKHAVRYENDPENTHAINIYTTAHEVEVGNLGDKGGCVLVPKGKVGVYKGNTTSTCFKDLKEISPTEKTTPTGALEHTTETDCHIK